MFGSSVHQDRAGPDYASIIDALTHGVSSTIQQVYLQKRLQADRAREDAQVAFQKEQTGIQNARATRQEAFDLDKFNEDKRKNRADEAYKGYHEDAHTTTLPTSGPTSAIQRAMTSPSFAPPAPTPDMQVTTKKAEPHYDLERSVPYRTAIDKATVSAEAAAARQQTLITARKAAAEDGVQARRELVQLQSRLKGGNNITRAMTGNAQEAMAQRWATGLVGRFSNSYDDAVDFLRSPEGEDYRAIGVKPGHIDFAREQNVKGGTGQAVGLQRSLDMPPQEAAATVRATREAVAGPPPRLRAPGAAPAPTAPAAKGAPAKSAAKVDESKLSDADLWEAKVKAGMPKDQATEYVKKRPKPKK